MYAKAVPYRIDQVHGFLQRVYTHDAQHQAKIHGING